jgi:hypothetical protein
VVRRAAVSRHNRAGWDCIRAAGGLGRTAAAGRGEKRVAAGTIPVRTPQGQAELGMRRRELSQRHRTVLFLIDGRRDIAEVNRMALQAGVPSSCLDDLLDLGLVALAEPTVALAGGAVADDTDVLHIDLPLDSGMALPDSLLPGESGTPDAAFIEARLILLRAVRAEAPIAGSLTALRLRRARGRADLQALLDEVEARITKPHRALAAAQTMRRVRLLLEGRLAPSLATA